MRQLLGPYSSTDTYGFMQYGLLLMKFRFCAGGTFTDSNSSGGANRLYPLKMWRHTP